MCNRYVSPTEADIERFWHIGRANQPRWWREQPAEIFPRAQGPFIRRAIDDSGYSREGASGRWGLVAGEWSLKYATNNARSEELVSKASFKGPWAKGQRCIIPAASFDEPNWESGRNQWWRFSRADGGLWGLAGLWNRWADPKTSEIVESYTMLTINADAHPLMRRMHKPDPKLPADQQDKRSVISIEREDVDQWLAGTIAEASELLRLAPVETFDAGSLTAL